MTRFIWLVFLCCIQKWPSAGQYRKSLPKMSRSFHLVLWLYIKFFRTLKKTSQGFLEPNFPTCVEGQTISKEIWKVCCRHYILDTTCCLTSFLQANNTEQWNCHHLESQNFNPQMFLIGSAMAWIWCKFVYVQQTMWATTAELPPLTASPPGGYPWTLFRYPLCLFPWTAWPAADSQIAMCSAVCLGALGEGESYHSLQAPVVVATFWWFADAPPGPVLSGSDAKQQH